MNHLIHLQGVAPCVNIEQYAFGTLFANQFLLKSKQCDGNGNSSFLLYWIVLSKYLKELYTCKSEI